MKKMSTLLVMSSCLWGGALHAQSTSTEVDYLTPIKELRDQISEQKNEIKKLKNELRAEIKSEVNKSFNDYKPELKASAPEKEEEKNQISPEDQEELNRIAQEKVKIQGQIDKLNAFVKGGLDETLITSSIKKLKENLAELTEQEEDVLNDIKKAKGKDGNLLQKVVISGYLKPYVMYGHNLKDVHFTQHNLYDATINFDVDVNKYVQGFFSLRYKETKSNSSGWFDTYMNKGYVVFKSPKKTYFTFKMGADYLPFGSFKSNQFFDTMSRSLFSTKESFIQTGVGSGNFKATIFAYNGVIKEENKSDAIPSYGAKIEYAIKGKDWALAMGFDYTNNIAESDRISGRFTTDATTNKQLNMKKLVGAYAGNFQLNISKFTLLGEYILTDRRFNPLDISYDKDSTSTTKDNQGARLSTWHLEFAYNTTIMKKKATLFIAAQQTNNAALFSYVTDNTTYNYPAAYNPINSIHKARYTLGFVWEAWTATKLGLEFFNDVDYDQSNWGKSYKTDTSIDKKGSGLGSSSAYAALFSMNVTY